jgi:hypothetical protein
MNDAARGKHRTEVTEVTEGDWGWGRKGLGGRVGFRARMTRLGEASHGGHGGNWGWGRKGLGGMPGFLCENDCRSEATEDDCSKKKQPSPTDTDN